MSDRTRLIRASTDILAVFGTRTEDGARLTAEWGEPIGHCAESDEWIYEPTFTRHDDDRLEDELRAEIARLEGLVMVYRPVYKAVVSVARPALFGLAAEATR